MVSTVVDTKNLEPQEIALDASSKSSFAVPTIDHRGRAVTPIRVAPGAGVAEVIRTIHDANQTKCNLSDAAINDLHLRTNAAKEELKGVTSQNRIAAVIKKYYDYRNGMPSYLNNPIFRQFVLDAATGDCAATRSLVNIYETNFIIGFFKAPYNKLLRKPSLELLTFDIYPIDNMLKDQFPSNAVAITNLRATKAFDDKNETLVALFGDMWAIKNKRLRNDPHAKAFYCVGKFLNRFIKYTVPAIASRHVDPRFFRNLRLGPKLTYKQRKQILDGTSLWLSTHEFHHCLGRLPRVLRDLIFRNLYLIQHRARDPSMPLQLDMRAQPSKAGSFSRILDAAGSNNIGIDEILFNNEKGFRFFNSVTGGALEELRADVLTLIKISDNNTRIELSDARFARNLILAERLFRYPIQLDPEGNFDSIASHFLLNYLIDQDAVIIENSTLRLADANSLTAALRSLHRTIKGFISRIDKKYNLHNKEEFNKARDELDDFVMEWANYHVTHPGSYSLSRRDLFENNLENMMKNRLTRSKLVEFSLHPFYQAMRRTLRRYRLVQPFLSDQRKTSNNTGLRLPCPPARERRRYNLMSTANLVA